MLRRRSSSAADAIAVACAVALLALALWLRGAALLHSGNRFYITLALTIGFALTARLLRGVNTSGALAGAVAAFTIASRDLRMFWVLLVVFSVTFFATRIGSLRKRALKIAEAEHGRSASQVMANLGVATLVLAAPSLASGYLLALAALAELAADTTSSEIGAAFSDTTFLITNGKRVQPGTDGGISLTGTVAGTIGALLIALCSAFLGLTPPGAVIAITCAAVGGMMVDSLLGATLERRGYLNNDTVNLLSTATAAGIMLLMRLV